MELGIIWKPFRAQCGKVPRPQISPQLSARLCTPECLSWRHGPSLLFLCLTSCIVLSLSDFLHLCLCHCLCLCLCFDLLLFLDTSRDRCLNLYLCIRLCLCHCICLCICLCLFYLLLLLHTGMDRVAVTNYAVRASSPPMVERSAHLNFPESNVVVKRFL